MFVCSSRAKRFSQVWFRRAVKALSKFSHGLLENQLGAPRPTKWVLLVPRPRNHGNLVAPLLLHDAKFNHEASRPNLTNCQVMLEWCRRTERPNCKKNNKSKWDKLRSNNDRLVSHHKNTTSHVSPQCNETETLDDLLFFCFRATCGPALQKDTDQPSKEEQGDKRVAIQPSVKKVGKAQVVI